MSAVTNIMILTLLDEDDESHDLFIDHLKVFTDSVRCREFLKINYGGGNKCLEADVFVGAFNAIDRKLFCNTIKQMRLILDDFEFDNLQIAIKSQEDYIWKIVKASELRVEMLTWTLIIYYSKEK